MSRPVALRKPSQWAGAGSGPPKGLELKDHLSVPPTGLNEAVRGVAPGVNDRGYRRPPCGRGRVRVSDMADSEPGRNLVGGDFRHEQVRRAHCCTLSSIEKRRSAERAENRPARFVYCELVVQTE